MPDQEDQSTVLTALQIEEAFERLKQALQQPSSPAWRLGAVHAFLESVRPLESYHETYLLELETDLERLAVQMPVDGFDPDIAAGVADGLRAITSGSSLWSNDVASRLDRAAAGVWLVVGSAEAAWPRLGGGVRPAWWQDGMALADLIRTADRTRHDEASWLRGLAARSARTGTCVPVVEGPMDPVSSDVRIGGMRDFWIEVAPSGGHAHSLVPAFEAYDLDGTTVKYEACLAAAVAIARPVRTYAGRVLQARPAPLRGRSAELALGGLMVAAIQKSDERRGRYVLRSDVALTGVLSDDGTVQPVDGLEPKVTAVFLSACHALVVPAAQLEAARAVRKGLAARYPNRSLTIIGVERLDDLFHDRRITRFDEPTRLGYAAGWLWRRRYSAGMLSVIGLLVATVAYLAFGPYDRDPYDYVPSPYGFEVTNRFGEVLWRADVVSRAGEVPTKEARALGTLTDLDGDGRLEFCWAAWSDSGLPDLQPGIGHILCGADGTIIDDWPMEFDIGYPEFAGEPQPFNPRALESLDIDGDGRDELLVSLSHLVYYPTLVVALNVPDRRVLGMYSHPGALYQMTLADLDGDGRMELYASGTNNAYRQAAVAVLDPYNLHGSGPGVGKYALPGSTPAAEQVYIRIPLDGIGELPGMTSEAAVDWQLITDHSLAFYVTEAHVRREGRKVLHAHIIYHFDNAFNPIREGTDSDYDELVEQLVKEGRWTPELADIGIHQAGIQFWDGESWRAEPPSSD